MKFGWMMICCGVSLVVAACGGTNASDSLPPPPLSGQITLTTTTTEGGVVSPRSLQVTSGQAANFTINADVGFDIGSITGCGGVLQGTNYHVAVAQESCNVHVQFQQKRYSLAVKSMGAGQVSPATTSVAHGSVGRINVTPAAEHDVIQVVSSCGGSYQQGVYTTAPMVAACDVAIEFGQKALLVTAVAGAGGTVTPATQRVAKGQVAQVTIEEQRGYKLKTASGCDGTLNVLRYTTAALSSSCRIDVAFNTLPVAVVAAPTSAQLGQRVELNGNMSSDADGDLIGYHFQVISAPAGSTASIVTDSPQDPTGSFTADKVGTYVLGLTVFDPWHRSEQSKVMLQVSRHNNAPLVWISAPLWAKVGELVKLDGSRSVDLDQDPLQFQWRFTSAPAGAKLDYASQSVAYFTPTVAGVYEVQLQVSDEFGGVATDTVKINVAAAAQNLPPNAVIEAPTQSSIGAVVLLSAASSSDGDGDPLHYRWRFVSMPAGSDARLMNHEQRDAQLRVDKAGSYVIELQVTDHAASEFVHTTVEVD